jgi:two-component system, OmpR family, sensor kinase
MTAESLNTVSLRLRVTLAAVAVLSTMMILLGVAVDGVFAAQSNRNLDAVLSGRVQLARQLARAGVGPQAIVNRVKTNAVQVRLELVNGQVFGDGLAPGTGVRSTTAVLKGPRRVDGAVLTLAVDASQVAAARRTLRRVLIFASLVVLGLSIALIAVSMRLALRPLSAMAALAQDIAGGQRGRRLSPTRTDTEIGRTAEAFDDMLDELEGAERRARQAEEQTRVFLADAAHELRTPITGVQAGAETLLHHGNELDAESRQRLELLLIGEARRAGRLVSDLLAAARLEAGLEIDRVEVSVTAIAQSEVERARLTAPMSSITLSGPEVIIPADPAKVAAILRNLLDNALRAAGPDGAVAVVSAVEGDQAVLYVADSGPGVPAADRERIFERLIRLDHARSTDSGGSGLGLAIARGYARAHDGELTCTEPNPAFLAAVGIRTGAVFRLSLPIHSPDQDAPPIAGAGSAEPPATAAITDAAIADGGNRAAAPASAPARAGHATTAAPSTAPPHAQT